MKKRTSMRNTPEWTPFYSGFSYNKRDDITNGGLLQQDFFNQPTPSHVDDMLQENSEELLKRELMNALKEHKKNKKKKPPCESNTTKMEMENGIQSKGRELKNLFDDGNATADMKELINYLFLPKKADKENVKVKALSEYKKQGAIPKRKFGGEPTKSDVSSLKQKRQSKNRTKSKGENSTEENATTTNGQNVIHKLVEDTIVEPFYYIVPKNPSPDFLFPQGSYYVVPQTPGSAFEGRVIFHPETGSEIIDSTQKDVLNKKSDFLSPKSINNLGKDTLQRQDSHLNIGPNENFGTILEGNLKSLETMKSIKTAVEERITELRKSLVESMRVLETLNTSLNLEENCLRKALSYDKILVKNEESVEVKLKDMNRYQQMVILFPDTDKKYLMEKVKDCEGDEDLFFSFLEEEYSRLAEMPEGERKIDKEFAVLSQEFPDQSVDLLFESWLDFHGDNEKLQRYIRNEKRRKRLKAAEERLLSEFPDLGVHVAKRLAKELTKDDSLEVFIESEKLNRKMQKEYERMVLALPDSSFELLRQKSEEFQGDERLADAYIKETKRMNKINSRVLDLQYIFPDAHLGFLRNEVEKLIDNEDKINTWTVRLLETNDYPKAEEQQYKLSVEKKKLWQTYVTDFNIRNYLLKVPDPRMYEGIFGNANRANKDYVVEYLNLRYEENITVENLRQTYFKNSFNITNTCLELDKLCPPVKLRQLNELLNENLEEAFLQEICYIDHRTEIRSYLDERNELRTIEEEEARIYDAFLICPLCANEELIASDAATCPDGHLFCKECIRRYVNIKIGDGSYTFNCPSENCQMPFSHSVLEQLLPESTLEKINKKRLAEEINIAEVDGLESCPFCEFAYIPNPADKIFRCQNPECLIETCRNCHEKNHIPLRCEELERPADLEARKTIEETMTRALLRECPKCKKKFMKIDGCNKILCPCGVIICYYCQKQITGYDHFNNRGGSCPLYSDNHSLHVVEVQRRGIEARDRIIAENPEVRILYDPTHQPAMQ